MAGMAGKYILDANAENVEATETIVTMRAFCFEVKMLYGTAGAEETTCGPFSSSDISFSIFTAEKESHLRSLRNDEA
jgi:hypothetical protein